jgi:ABC-type polysaccharide/polyol phosphate export permease
MLNFQSAGGGGEDISKRENISIGFFDKLIPVSMFMLALGLPIFFTGVTLQGIALDRQIYFYFWLMLGLVAWVSLGVVKGELRIAKTPLTIGEYTASLIVTSIATSALGLVGMILFAGLAFGLDFAAYGVLFAPFLLVLFLMGIALGIFGVALVLRFGPSAEWFIWPIPGILAPFAGVFYPVSTLPTWMQWVSALVPPSYIFEGMRALLAGKPFNPGAYFLALGLSIAYIAVMYAFFISVYRRAVRTGLLARYSAETAV